MARRRTPAGAPRSSTTHTAGQVEPSQLRIIGGTMRGRQVTYSGDPRTRPMKDRVREALFNLVGGYCAGKHAIDLFAGTGALGFEALSRGAARATLVERHFPTVRLLGENARALGVESRVTIEAGDAFYWARQADTWRPETWLLLFSPPWELFRERNAEMIGLLTSLVAAAPPESVLVVEADVDWDTGQLPQADLWRVRDYPPARIAVLRTAAVAMADD